MWLRAMSRISLLNASIGDCSTQLTVRFPSYMNITHRHTVEGELITVTSDESKDSDCFKKAKFQGSGIVLGGIGLNYVYTSVERVRRLCAEHKSEKGGGEYPLANSASMKFEMTVTNGKLKETCTGDSTPLFVNNQYYMQSPSQSVHGLVNISYIVRIFPNGTFKLNKFTPLNDALVFDAEGIYDKETGSLCLLGCLTFDYEKSSNNDSRDCEVFINVRLPPLNGDGMIKGIIKSMRGKSDSRYFEPLFLSAYYLDQRQAIETMGMMDLDIVMALMCYSLTCVFLVLQLRYIKNHPEALPHISLVMLTLLTLGYILPLLLNFEAFAVDNRSRQSIFFGKDGLFEVNEITVRVVTMVAFLLQFRLLQLAWSSRHSAGSHNRLWKTERRTVCVLLPLCLAAALTSWFLDQQSSSERQNLHRQPGSSAYKYDHLWFSLKYCGGLVMDLFLLPQIIFNCWLNSTESVLVTYFYTGTTLARVTPHAYRFYRCRDPWLVNLLNVTGSSRLKPSTVWDMVMPILCSALAVIIFLQQRYGGLCVFRRKHSQILEKQRGALS